MNYKHLELYNVVLWDSALGVENVLFIILYVIIPFTSPSLSVSDWISVLVLNVTT